MTLTEFVHEISQQIVDLRGWTSFIGTKIIDLYTNTGDNENEDDLRKFYILLEAEPGIVQRELYRKVRFRYNIINELLYNCKRQGKSIMAALYNNLFCTREVNCLRRQQLAVILVETMSS